MVYMYHLDKTFEVETKADMLDGTAFERSGEEMRSRANELASCVDYVGSNSPAVVYIERGRVSAPRM